MSQVGKGGKGGGVISYRVEFGEEQTELVPHTNIFLKADQVCYNLWQTMQVTGSFIQLGWKCSPNRRSW